jgi:hypothetical protein
MWQCKWLNLVDNLRTLEVMSPDDQILIRFANIARGTTDPGIASITWIISPATKQANSLESKIQVKHSIGSNFGH